MEEAKSYKALTDQSHRQYLEFKLELERSALTESAVEDIISEELRINLYVQTCRSRFEFLFGSYSMFLRHHGVRAVIETPRLQFNTC